MDAWDERTSLPISLGSATLYPFPTHYISMVDMTESLFLFLVLAKQTSKTFFETAIGDFSC